MTVEQRLQQMLRELLDDDTVELGGDTVAQDVPGWDSYVHINLMYRIEQELGVPLPGNKIFEFKNFGELKRYVIEHLSARRTELS